MAYRENNWDLTSRVIVTAFGENSLSELESYEKVLELALPLGRELPSDAELIPECWLRAEDLRCVCANGTLEVNLSVKAEGAILQRSGNTCVGSIALGEPLTPADPEISLRIYYAQAGGGAVCHRQAVPCLPGPDACRQRPCRGHHGH